MTDVQLPLLGRSGMVPLQSVRGRRRKMCEGRVRNMPRQTSRMLRCVAGLQDSARAKVRLSTATR